MNDTKDKKKKSEAQGESQRLEEETMPEDLIDLEDDESPIEDIKDDINLKVKLDEANDRILRMAAEMENSRKRGLKEKEDAIKYSTTKFARDIVTVADDLERAIESIKDINLDGNEA
ncbi:MAG: nucleotide exchange factor GrpE, partial [Hyphomicrobiales bacterium]